MSEYILDEGVIQINEQVAARHSPNTIVLGVCVCVRERQAKGSCPGLAFPSRPPHRSGAVAAAPPGFRLKTRVLTFDKAL